MRERSQARLDRTRARYELVLESAQRAVIQYDTFNAGMRDVVLYLGVDLNHDAIQDIHEDARSIAMGGKELRNELGTCVQASEEYVSMAAPLGQLEVAVAPAEAPQK